MGLGSPPTCRARVCPCWFVAAAGAEPARLPEISRWAWNFAADRIVTLPAWLKALTDFGDAAVLTPLAAVMLLWLLLNRCPRDAAWWTIAVAFCAGLTALLKISFYGCPPTPDLHSPSGHASLSTLVYGTMTLATASHTRGLSRMIAIGGGAGFILAIAASRLLLYAHSGPEVGLGLVVGTAALALFAQRYLRYRAAQVWLSPLFVTSGALLLVLHGRHFRIGLSSSAIFGHGYLPWPSGKGGFPL
jgi:hypothetical protein